jgi:prolyl-tRNA synthetase
VPTPGKSTCEEVAELLQLPLARTVKCLMLWADGRVHMLLLRGDHMGNEVKIGKLPGMDGWRFRIGSRDHRGDRLQARLPGACRNPEGNAADRRPFRGRDGRFRLRRERSRLSTCAA